MAENPCLKFSPHTTNLTTNTFALVRIIINEKQNSLHIP